MLYKEMNYTQKREYEATLTIGQRAKLRRMEKAQKEQIQPIQWASNAREEEIRKEAWKTLDCTARINASEAEYAPRVNAIQEQINALHEELSALKKEAYDKRSDISIEPYQVVADDPEVKAMHAIWKKTREVQERNFQELVDSFAKVDA